MFFFLSLYIFNLSYLRFPSPPQSRTSLLFSSGLANVPSHWRILRHSCLVFFFFLFFKKNTINNNIRCYYKLYSQMIVMFWGYKLWVFRTSEARHNNMTDGKSVRLGKIKSACAIWCQSPWRILRSTTGLQPHVPMLISVPYYLNGRIQNLVLQPVSLQ